jgi:Holliday junction resolvase RusA-like endonuclease
MTEYVRSPIIEIAVYGTPAPQGSKSFKGISGGRGIMVESSKKVKPWRDAVRADAIVERQAMTAFAVLDEPLYVEMVFTFVRPRSHYRTGRNAHLLRDGAPTRPSAKPDVSKLCRSTEDALTDAGIWRDDARVVEYTRLAKVFAGEDKDALDSPGAVIRVYRNIG